MTSPSLFPCISPKTPYWHADGSLRVAADEDIYFSKQGGIDESRHVFLEGNRLPERWADGGDFCVGELGFGCGLNFLVTLEAFYKEAHQHSRLTYIGFERHPVPKNDLKKILEKFPELPSEDLLGVYPHLQPGHHLLEVAPKVNLLLVLGDARRTLKDTHCAVDAWYCDGFAPKTDMTLWEEELFSHLYKKTKPGGTFATYSVAKVVREALSNVGFVMEKSPGFGTKREMLKGCKVVASKPEAMSRPWFCGWEVSSFRPEQSVAVVGGGIAGTSVARALAERGLKIDVFEAGAFAEGANANPAAIIKPHSLQEMTWQSAFYHAAFALACSRINVLARESKEKLFDKFGAFMPGEHPEELWGALQSVDADSTKALTGCALDSPGAFVEEALAVYPGVLCSELVKHENIQVFEHHPVNDLSRQHDGWSIHGRGQVFGAIVFASGFALKQSLRGNEYPIIPARGQVSLLEPDGPVADLASMLEGKGFVIPKTRQEYVVGASYVRDDDTTELRDAEHVANIEKAATLFGQAHAAKHFKVRGGYAGVRATTPDRMPLIGPVEHRQRYLQDYEDIRHGALHRAFPVGEYHPGLYVSGGYGSWGFSGAFLGAAIIRALLCVEPLPISLGLFERVLPCRFVMRDLQRQPAKNING
ncbi:MAG: bifunctional tRNA (5-methylaminomethyl-2-thiouridine)(34)-methyltransferase MnmD/FAD-dependent 5-carboxymethylaminomethyl-2-thiouridine(34) oxidoreductase MnmC [Myxococcota bacterium]|nr:bifunctional tRNA (5-methylaminomethyl-2-thiouridine)(34)-methyltransferase MnmD/FAD-dependent 5-carboxymethylaminomethyl-2-thiouridine(34) oxidoreductase MnmC [Myxococcota bacterium]